MGRLVVSGGGATPAGSNSANFITGTFGSGATRWFTASGSFVVPDDVSSVRVRLWGGGAAGGGGSQTSGGGGGGFALKVISSLTSGDSIPVTVGAGGQSNAGFNGGTSSFGSYVSATGGTGANDRTNGNHVGGTGIGGDINASGGGISTYEVWGVTEYGNSGGGGAGSLLGDGNHGVNSNDLNAGYSAIVRGGAGGGMGGGSGNVSNSARSYPYHPLFTQSPVATFVNGGLTATAAILQYAHPMDFPITTIDMIGTGGGGIPGVNGHNGGGGGGTAADITDWKGNGGFPGGGGGAGPISAFGWGAPGLVIVEY